MLYLHHHYLTNIIRQHCVGHLKAFWHSGAFQSHKVLSSQVSQQVYTLLRFNLGHLMRSEESTHWKRP